MLHIKVLAVGKLKEAFWRDACNEYLKRLGPYAQMTICEVEDLSTRGESASRNAMDTEAKGILRQVGQDDFLIALDMRGKRMSSQGIADFLEDLSIQGNSSIAFAIGGSVGLGKEVLNRANAKWSLGDITLPHNLARVVLLEQVYRAFKIIKGEPYHK